MTLWLAAAGLVVVAVGLVIVAGRGDDGERADLPTLPMGAGATVEEAGEAAADMSARPQADMTLLPFVDYVPGEGLPELGGEAPAYRLGGEDATVGADDVAELAEALGIDGEPTENDGVWHVDDGDRALDVYGAEGSWSTYAIAATSSSGAGATPEAQAEADARAAGADSANAADGAAASDAVAPAVELSPEELAKLCPDDPRAMPGSSGEGGGSVDNAGGVVDLEIPCEPPTGDPVPLPEPLPMPTEPFEPPVRPENLPSEDEARSIALDLLGATGVDTDDAEVTVEDGITEWFVTVEPRLGGLPAPGLSMYVGVGGDGEITMASGYLADAEELGDYPLLDTTAALERLNEQYGGMMSAADTATASASSAVAADDDVATGAAEPALDPALDPAAPVTEPDVVTTEPVPPPRDVGDDLPVLTVPPSTALPPDTMVPEPTVPPIDPGDEPTTTIPGDPGPVEPPPATEPPAPAEVAVTDAELVLLMEVAWDGSGTYLVPGYRFTADDQSSPVVTAVVDDLVEPPPTDGDLPVEDGPGEVPPVGPDTPVEQPAVEQPADDEPAGEAPGIGNPDPRPAVQPDDATGG